MTTVGQFVDLTAPMQKINVHVRGGYIIPMQVPGPNLILGRANPFTLLVVPSESGVANGNLYWDDGDSVGMFFILYSFIKYIFIIIYCSDPIQTKIYNYFEISLKTLVSKE